MLGLLRKPWQLRSPLVIYGPLLPWVLYLCIRHRLWPSGLLKLNPAFAHGGWVIVSKYQRYLVFRECGDMCPTVLVPRGNTGAEALASYLEDAGIPFPVVAKPDIGFMGRGIRKFENALDLAEFLRGSGVDYLIQPYIEASHEFAILYCRRPSSGKGTIVDVTERVLPRVIGDGRSSVETLINSEPRWTSIARAAIKDRCPEAFLRSVPPAGIHVPLGIAAGSATGAVFIDRRELISEALRTWMDSVASTAPGFYVGKFDVKASSPDALVLGRNLVILEVNGSTSELTWIFDRRTSYRQAILALAEYFSILFRVAADNRALQRPRIREVVGDLRRWRKMIATIPK